ncbi:putative kelch repeat protein [Blattamonas nauphoetae]|uniref:Kelch repeat protein n=1 Tax=Blattamonas nauphoetae TaxID=2049346 RepID=A0ABQ9YK79_9EUKA|nr:putative kelch repeat protein [Blattamonas nauphoetae]
MSETEICRWEPVTIKNANLNYTTHTLVSYDNKMLLYGGRGTDPSIMMEINLDSMDSVQMKTHPDPRFYHSSTRVGDHIYIFGGKDFTIRVNDLYQFSIKDKTATHLRVSGAVPEPRGFHSMVAYEGNLYLFGGSNSDDSDYPVFQELHKYTIADRKWSIVEPKNGSRDPNVPGKLNRHTAVVIQDTMYVFGGVTAEITKEKLQPSHFNNSVYSFNFKTNLWKKSPPFRPDVEPCGRYNHCAVALFGKMYIFGGREKALMNDLWEYNPDTSEWRVIPTVGTPPVPSYYAACCTVGSHLYVQGGTTYKMPWVDSETLLSSFHRIDLKPLSQSISKALDDLVGEALFDGVETEQNKGLHVSSHMNWPDEDDYEPEQSKQVSTKRSSASTALEVFDDDEDDLDGLCFTAMDAAVQKQHPGGFNMTDVIKNTYTKVTTSSVLPIMITGSEEKEQEPNDSENALASKPLYIEQRGGNDGSVHVGSLVLAPLITAQKDYLQTTLESTNMTLKDVKLLPSLPIQYVMTLKDCLLPNDLSTAGMSSYQNNLLSMVNDIETCDAFVNINGKAHLVHSFIVTTRFPALEKHTFKRPNLEQYAALVRQLVYYRSRNFHPKSLEVRSLAESAQRVVHERSKEIQALLSSTPPFAVDESVVQNFIGYLYCDYVVPSCFVPPYRSEEYLVELVDRYYSGLWMPAAAPSDEDDEWKTTESALRHFYIEDEHWERRFAERQWEKNGYTLTTVSDITKILQLDQAKTFFARTRTMTSVPDGWEVVSRDRCFSLLLNDFHNERMSIIGESNRPRLSIIDPPRQQPPPIVDNVTPSQIIQASIKLNEQLPKKADGTPPDELLTTKQVIALHAIGEAHQPRLKTICYNILLQFVNGTNVNQVIEETKTMKQAKLTKMFSGWLTQATKAQLL